MATQLGIRSGGWCPRGRKAEDGTIPERYRLKQTASAGYVERTRLNVQDSDGTLVFTMGRLTAGSRQTIQIAKKLARPVLHLDLDALSDEEVARQARLWIESNRIRILNVAGSRESTAKGLSERVRATLLKALGAP